MAQVLSVQQMAEDPNFQEDIEDVNELGRWFVRTQNGESQNVFVEQTEVEDDNGDLTYSVTFRVSPYGEDDIQVDVFHPNEPVVNPPTYVLMDPQDAAQAAEEALIANNQNNNNNNMQNNNAPQQGGKRRNTRRNRRNSRKSSRKNRKSSRKSSRKSRKSRKSSRKNRSNRSNRRH